MGQDCRLGIAVTRWGSPSPRQQQIHKKKNNIVTHFHDHVHYVLVIYNHHKKYLEDNNECHYL